MQLRTNAGSRPQITFTSDFHELVQGDLVPGPCMLRYDPLRIVEAEEAETTNHRICVHVRFHPINLEWQGQLELPPGQPLAELADATGQGFMLTTTFDIPAGCNELEVWFSCTHEDGHTHWDSDRGKNHWLRFGLADLTLKTAKVKAAKSKSAAQDAFEFQLTTPPSIESVSVVWWVTSNRAASTQTTALSVTATSAAGKTWQPPGGSIPVPKGATIAFEVVYYVAGRKYTDTNQGRWYVAD